MLWLASTASLNARMGADEKRCTSSTSKLLYGYVCTTAVHRCEHIHPLSVTGTLANARSRTCFRVELCHKHLLAEGRTQSERFKRGYCNKPEAYLAAVMVNERLASGGPVCHSDLLFS